MLTSIQYNTSRTVYLGLVVLALAFSSVAAGADNPLVGQWEPAGR